MPKVVIRISFFFYAIAELQTLPSWLPPQRQWLPLWWPPLQPCMVS